MEASSSDNPGSRLLPELACLVCLLLALHADWYTLRLFVHLPKIRSPMRPTATCTCVCVLVRCRAPFLRARETLTVHPARQALPHLPTPKVSILRATTSCTARCSTDLPVPRSSCAHHGRPGTTPPRNKEKLIGNRPVTFAGFWRTGATWR